MRIYRYPPAFDERMNRKVRHILQWAIPIYCIACIWVFGNPNILEKTNIVDFDAKSYANDVTDQDLDSFFAGFIKFFDRATNLYGLPFFIILLLYTVYFALGFVIKDLLGLIYKILFGCCKVKLKKDNTRRDMWFDARIPR